jgi:hypothetical protein
MRLWRPSNRKGTAVATASSATEVLRGGRRLQAREDPIRGDRGTQPGQRAAGVSCTRVALTAAPEDPRRESRSTKGPNRVNEWPGGCEGCCTRMVPHN